MKHFLLLLSIVLVAFGSSAQEYKSRFPYPSEQILVAGLDWYPRDGIRQNPWIHNILVNNTNLLTGATNNYVILNNAGAVLNAVIVLESPTNNFRSFYKVVTFGNTTATLTNAAGVSFTSVTNAVATTYSIPTNTTVDIICTTTNYLVIPNRF